MQNIEFLLAKKFGDRFKINYPLANYTSFKCGGNAKYLVFPENIEEVREILNIAKEYKIEYFFLGKGTNLLISDTGFNGIMISTLRINNYFLEEENNIRSECGVTISKLLKLCIINSLTGIEFLSGIPGTVGGAIKNNSGIKDKWILDKIEYVKFLDILNMEIKIKKRHEINFGYRKSEFNENTFIWEVKFILEKGDKRLIIEKIRDFLNERKMKQPTGYSAGSIFKNPYPFFAGELIEKCGLKGYKIGDCVISEKHANFIINQGQGKAKDVFQLIQLIKSKVKEKFGIDLELEIQLIGDFK